jgi:hypothetical protein
MDCKPCNSDDAHADLLACLRESARRGDWRNALRLAEKLSRMAPPAAPRELGEHLCQLRETVIVAKASRADTSATLSRLRAAARFNRSALAPVAGRQDPGNSADF